MSNTNAEVPTPQHYLIVADHSETDDIFEVEHDDSCPLVSAGYGMHEGQEIMDYGCLVGQLVTEAGLEFYFHREGDANPGYATTPLTPGKYVLHGYAEKHSVPGYASTYEWDAGLAVDEPAP